MTTTPPLLNPRVIALAHYAARGILERVLARHGLTFQQSVTLRLAAVAEDPVERQHLVDGVVDSLKIEAAEADAVVDELIASGALSPQQPSRIRITEAGRQLHETTSAETAPLSARVYDGIPEEELAVAGRVLSLITERANRELAALTA
ncbi:winged helix DNA-binding protein [Streptomyces sp. 351MFTsu5.1]|uniref:winged helix DNA-binding protein n=1 Tax=Streptomyces sp. 351MFTsu5.1 TaxID=1172180 RepID=UPI000377ACEC|nr:winged helix DNA-binding protein [Streptomyces sp. 351MFTsu5.1]